MYAGGPFFPHAVCQFFRAVVGCLALAVDFFSRAVEIFFGAVYTLSKDSCLKDLLNVIVHVPCNVPSQRPGFLSFFFAGGAVLSSSPFLGGAALSSSPSFGCCCFFLGVDGSCFLSQRSKKKESRRHYTSKGNQTNMKCMATARKLDRTRAPQHGILCKTCSHRRVQRRGRRGALHLDDEALRLQQQTLLATASLLRNQSISHRRRRRLRVELRAFLMAFRHHHARGGPR